MGSNQSSENIVNNAIKSLVSTTATAVLNQGTFAGGSNAITFDGCDNMHDIVINQDNAVKIDARVAMEAVQSSMAENDVTNMVKQATEQIAQNVSFNLSNQDQTQITNQMMDIATSIQQSTTTNCSTSTFMSNSVTCTNSTGIHNIMIDQSSVSNILLSCAMSSNQSNSAKTKLINTIDQMAKQKQEDAILSLALLVLAGAVALMAPMIGAGYMGGKLMKSAALQSMLWLVFMGCSLGYWDRSCVGEKNAQLFKIPLINLRIFPNWCTSESIKWGSFSFLVIAGAGSAFAIYKMTESSGTSQTLQSVSQLTSAPTLTASLK